MSLNLSRREFIRESLLSSAALPVGGLALPTGPYKVLAQGTGEKGVPRSNSPRPENRLAKGKIGDLSVSRLLLGGNLLTHFTHSRDLKYVYNLAAHYNTEEKILETLAVAEAHGIDTLVIHTIARAMNILKKYRYERGGKIKWIICPTAVIDDAMQAYREQVEQIVEMGVDAVYLWGVRADQLVSESRADLIAKAVEIAKDYEVPSGVGAHDLRVVIQCERQKINADFYIKTLHHHNYPSAPNSGELTQVTSEVPGYWCNNPGEVIDFMKDVDKPWIAFKVMAAGAIPPQDALPYAFENGADHVIAGMFDFEIAEDAQIAKAALSKVNRSRPWRS